MSPSRTSFASRGSVGSIGSTTSVSSISSIRSIKSIANSVSRWWKPNRDMKFYDHPESSSPDAPAFNTNTFAEPSSKKYVHVPRYAASSFMMTTSSREIKQANEVL